MPSLGHTQTNDITLHLEEEGLIESLAKPARQLLIAIPFSELKQTRMPARYFAQPRRMPLPLRCMLSFLLQLLLAHSFVQLF